MSRIDVVVAASGLAVLGAAVVLRRRLVAVTVEGRSMEPTLRDGDRVLVLRRTLGRVRRGSVVVVERPEPGVGWSHLRPPRWRLDGRTWYVKRAVALPGDPVPPSVAPVVGAGEGSVVPRAALVVIGDGVSSSDSRRWGFFPAERLLGVVVARLPRAGSPAGPQHG
ncbi:S26 family signal peptidase [Micromonospora cathayae]|uniref:S26 family signal peptidase n=1 Tax=Micromonospora cathayae TaxID=3028804 RepID=A0ABY7ZJ15_9ACTN|nr:S26 family signal peptidase [Micromonospora sp. HUAS 3]WDZ82862.1 S26 family signal peptidase [Micromonospora sp. HUAS 3]